MKKKERKLRNNIINHFFLYLFFFFVRKCIEQFIILRKYRVLFTNAKLIFDENIRFKELENREFFGNFFWINDHFFFGYFLKKIFAENWLLFC